MANTRSALSIASECTFMRSANSCLFFSIKLHVFENYNLSGVNPLAFYWSIACIDRALLLAHRLVTYARIRIAGIVVTWLCTILRRVSLTARMNELYVFMHVAFARSSVVISKSHHVTRWCSTYRHRGTALAFPSGTLVSTTSCLPLGLKHRRDRIAII